MRHCCCNCSQAAAGGTGCSWGDVACAEQAAAMRNWPPMGPASQGADVAANERGTPKSHAHSALGYQSVHRVKNDHRTAPPAFLRKGLLQLGRVLNAPFRYRQQSHCCAPMAKGHPLGLPRSLGRFRSSSATKGLHTAHKQSSMSTRTNNTVCALAYLQGGCWPASMRRSSGSRMRSTRQRWCATSWRRTSSRLGGTGTTQHRAASSR